MRHGRTVPSAAPRKFAAMTPDNSPTGRSSAFPRSCSLLLRNVPRSTDPARTNRGDGEAARRRARHAEDRRARAREILQFAERRTEGAVQFAAFGLQQGGVKNDR